MWEKILIISCALPLPSAWAAPWIRDDGGWYARTSLTEETVEGLRGIRRDAYLEYGLTSDWTVTLKGEAVSYAASNGFDGNGWRVSARRLIYDGASIKLSVELGALQGEAIGGRNGCERLGAEVRTGIAWSGTFRDQSTFVFLEGVGRFHNGCDRQRLEGGVGIESFPSIWAITQVWIERGSQSSVSDKVQTEWLWRSDVADFSLGFRQEVSNTFQEQGIFIAVAKQF